MQVPPLQPGDHLLYFTPCLIDYVICVKTWSHVGHIEVFDGRPDGMLQLAMASRSAGVDRYAFRLNGLRYVLRPKKWDHAAATAWFEREARGQKYDYLGLLCFTLALKQGSPNRMFCSEFARNLDRAAGCPSFAPWWPGDLTAPGSYLMSPGFDVVFDYQQPDKIAA